ncbi:DUF4369 domain-containing protein [Flavobacterium sp. MK4S-17]|uniref:DUF4369 domain-containing protein n=1 Tax=Flavobacterium sp. MK4S-17 TaxID=2543737 RepID=UPI00135BF36E|nr:DUF4369 domain-containing protein [Flavobacterium sp. MK4S-17]
MKRLISALLVIAVFTACNKKDYGDANLHITGNIKGLKKGKLYIQKVVDTALVAIDTIIINGKSSFESHIKLDSPEMLYLFLDRGQTNSIDNNLPFFAEPGNMRIESSNEEFFAKAKITGSENQKVYEDYVKIRNRFNGDKLDLIEKSLEAAKKGDVKMLDSIEQKADHLLKRRYLYTANFALNNSKYEVAPYLALSEIYDANIKYLDTIRKSMSPEVAKSHYGKMLTKYVEDRKKSEAENMK